MEALLQNLYTAISIIIVFHLYSMQQWLEKMAQYESTADELLATSSRVDISRERLRRQTERLRSNFPWIQVTLLLACITALAAIGVAIGLKLPQYSQTFTIAPTLIMWGVSIVGTIAVWLKGRSFALDIFRKLE